MNRITSGRSVRLPVGALLAFLTCIAVAPARSQAGCSRYVSHFANHDSLSRFLLTQLVNPTDIFTGTSLPTPLSEPPPRCTGTACSGNPALPSTPPLVAMPRFVEHWATIETLFTRPDVGSRSFHHTPTNLRPILATTAIFHPPRWLNGPVALLID